ncbi:MAG: hypothetical protein GC190_20680 [Alphaproteobacteria bacterium]|nr:hypothetical protein [Alphaproteobacteria bacterium]
MAADEPGSRKSMIRHAAPWGAAVVLHVLFFIAFGYLIAPPPDLLKPDETVVPLAWVHLAPPPPRLEGELAPTSISIMPRFRPRYYLPKGVPLISTREYGNAAEALFRYWCTNRPDTIESTGRLCPSDVPFNGLAALPEHNGLIGNSDAGALLGAGDRGYTIDEAAARRGWVKPKPPTGQDGLQTKTDKATGAHSDDVYGGYPWDATPYGH